MYFFKKFPKSDQKRKKAKETPWTKTQFTVKSCSFFRVSSTEDLWDNFSSLSFRGIKCEDMNVVMPKVYNPKHNSETNPWLQILKNSLVDSIYQRNQEGTLLGAQRGGIGCKMFGWIPVTVPKKPHTLNYKSPCRIKVHTKGFKFTELDAESED